MKKTKQEIIPNEKRDTHSFCCLKKREREREHGLEREKRRTDTSFRWVNNERLRLPRHTYGTTSNKQTKDKEREILFMIMVHVSFVGDLYDSSIFDEFLEYVDLINVSLEINLDFLIEMMILMNLEET